MSREIRVRAQGDGCFPLHDGTHTLMGRYCGRVKGLVTTDGTIPATLPEGEWVPSNSYYHRGIADGSLELLEERG